MKHLQKHIRRLALSLPLFAAALSLSGCGFFQAMNQREKIRDVHVGMTKSEVAAVMGEPLKDEHYNTDRVWYYYTNPKWYDAQVTSDECTPFVFDEDGRLAGFGHEYYRKIRPALEWQQSAIDESVERFFTPNRCFY